MSKFKPGKSGNPQGRPKGIADRRTLLSQIDSKDMQTILSNIVGDALKGDQVAQRMLLDKCMANPKPVHDAVVFELNSNDSLSVQANSILNSAASGQIAPDIAQGFIRSLADVARIAETSEIMERLDKLEEASK